MTTISPSEKELQSALLLAAPAAIPNLRLFRRNIGKARFKSAVVSFAIKGQSDLYGIWRGGRVIELELKTSTGALSPEQLSWQAFCRSWGVSHLVLRAREGESTSDTVARWIIEIRHLALAT